jgi:ribose-phosphate pyrophosphokinase
MPDPDPEQDLVVFSGNSNQELVREICEYLETPVGRCEVGQFSDGEIRIEIAENVRGRDVFLVQSTSTPVNDHLMELLIMIDAARRASAASITAVVPYFGYARQDRKVAPRTPITARLVADLITSAGADRFVSMDLHAGQIQGFFDMPSDHLYASPVLVEDMKKKYGSRTEECVMVSPDAGGVERARAFAKRLGTTLAIVDKRRPKSNVAEVMQIVGDVRGKTAIMLDDMIDTAGTLTLGAKALADAGAKRIVAYAVHPVLSGPAIERLASSAIEEVVVTNTVPLRDNARNCSKIQQLSVARIFGEAIRRIHSADSLSSLFV